MIELPDEKLKRTFRFDWKKRISYMESTLTHMIHKYIRNLMNDNTR